MPEFFRGFDPKKTIESIKKRADENEPDLDSFPRSVDSVRGYVPVRDPREHHEQAQELEMSLEAQAEGLQLMDDLSSRHAQARVEDVVVQLSDEHAHTLRNFLRFKANNQQRKGIPQQAFDRTVSAALDLRDHLPKEELQRNQQKVEIEAKRTFDLLRSWTRRLGPAAALALLGLGGEITNSHHEQESQQVISGDFEREQPTYKPVDLRNDAMPAPSLARNFQLANPFSPISARDTLVTTASSASSERPHVVDQKEQQHESKLESAESLWKKSFDYWLGRSEDEMDSKELDELIIDSDTERACEELYGMQNLEEQAQRFVAILSERQKKYTENPVPPIAPFANSASAFERSLLKGYFADQEFDDYSYSSIRKDWEALGMTDEEIDRKAYNIRTKAELAQILLDQGLSSEELAIDLRNLKKMPEIDPDQDHYSLHDLYKGLMTKHATATTEDGILVVGIAGADERAVEVLREIIANGGNLENIDPNIIHDALLSAQEHLNEQNSQFASGELIPGKQNIVDLLQRY